MGKRKTHEEFVREVFELVGKEYTVLGEYVNNRTRIPIKHNVCNYIHNQNPCDFLNGIRCPKCSGKLPYNTETFREKIYSLVEDEYTVIGEFINTKTKININHNICGYNYFVIPNDFLRNKRCPKCSGKLPYTTKIFKEKITELTNNEYELIGEYGKNNKNKVTMKHNISSCNFIWNVSPNSFLSKGTRCPKCAGLLPYNIDTYKQKVFELVGNEYEVLGNYINSQTKILMKHNICNHEYYVIPTIFLYGIRCPKCNGNNPYTTKEFKNKVNDITFGEYEVLNEYINTNTNVLFKHKLCNNIFFKTPHSFLNSVSCPFCISSKGEEVIRLYLNKYNIKHDKQFRYSDCRYILPLPFDFAIFNNNDKIKFLIEYDGEQHYKPISVFGGKETFEKLKINDEIKSNYCNKNNIPLLRIPYWEFNNIENILNEWLLNYEDVKNTSSFNLSN